MGSKDKSIRESIPKVNGKVVFDEPMSVHTSFKLGGPADIFAVPENVEDLQVILRWANENALPVFLLGAGTNLLVSDRGIRGLVIQLGVGFNQIHIRNSVLRAGAAARLSRVLRKSLGRGLSGLEGIAGVPGTVGGAICMNAGTSAGYIGDALDRVVAMDLQGEVSEVPASELGLSYRQSAIKEKKIIITGAIFQLRPQESGEINNIITELLTKRKHTQPVGIGTAGSVFKNPSGGYAGQILEKVGAKGTQVGGARVSSKHANFIENTGAASAEDVHNLIVKLQELAKSKAGVVLEPEIEIVGEW